MDDEVIKCWTELNSLSKFKFDVPLIISYLTLA